MQHMKDEGRADITPHLRTKDRCLEKGGMYMRDLLEQCLAPFPSLCTVHFTPQLPNMHQG